MGLTTTNTPANDLVSLVEGTTKWNETTLSFYYYTDSAEEQTILGAEAIVYTALGYAVPDMTEVSDISGHAYLANSIQNAMDNIELLTGLTFTAAADLDSADVKFLGYGFPENTTGATIIGQAQFPEENTQTGGGYEGYILFRDAFPFVDAATGGGALQDYLALHELAHFMGLGHPHDTGNGSLMVDEDTAFLDSIRYTTMSYNYGNADNSTYNSGYTVTMSALDIAALQDMYGVNNTAYIGDTVYSLMDAGDDDIDLDGSDDTVAVGEALYTIWDADGQDSIDYSGSNSVYINLNSATLTLDDTDHLLEIATDFKKQRTYKKIASDIQDDILDPETHAGGFLSRVFNYRTKKMQKGGFSIAEGATLEDASGRNREDILIGNDGDNSLYGNGSHDLIHGGYGDDIIDGGVGNDILYGGSGDDIFYTGAGKDLVNGGDGTDIVDYSAETSKVVINLARNRNTGSAVGDSFESIEEFYLTNSHDSFTGGKTSVSVYGGIGKDYLIGGTGNDMIVGGADGDKLSGGKGSDIFFIEDITESEFGAGLFDTILDFKSGQDSLVIQYTATLADVSIRRVGRYSEVTIADTDFMIRMNTINKSDITFV